MKRIKVAQVITRMDWGGAPDMVRILCDRLDPELYETKLISGLTKHPSEKTKEFFARLKGLRIEISYLQRDVHLLKDLAAFVKLYLLFRKERFDLVHTHTAKAGALARLAAFLSGTPVIIHTPHGHNFYGYFGPWVSKLFVHVEKFLARFTDRIIALTELEKNDFISFGVTDERNISVIYQGLELSREALKEAERAKLKIELGIEPEESVVGLISRLEPVKGAAYFLEAAFAVSERFKTAKFILAGEGSLREELLGRIQGRGLEKRILLTGWQEEPARILSLLDILVLPSLNEAVGMVLIEAQAMGVAVVASRVGGIPEIVKDNETGILVPPADPQALTKAISTLLSDKQKRRLISEAARRWIGDRFTPQAMAQKTRGLYEELIRKKSSVKSSAKFSG